MEEGQPDYDKMMQEQSKMAEKKAVGPNKNIFGDLLNSF